MTAVDALSFTERRQADRAAAKAFPLRAEVVGTREGLDAMAHQWTGLEERTPGATVFQGLGWARAVFDFEAERGNPDFQPVIATLSDGQRLVGLLPLERIRTGARNVLVPLGHAFGQYADALVAGSAEPDAVVAQLLKVAIGAGPVDTVSLLKVRDGSALARGLPANHIVTGEAQGAPFVDLSSFADFTEYFATVKPKTRKNMRNDRNRLEREGPVDHHVSETEAETLGVIERTLIGRSERLRDQGLTSRAFRDSGFADFCKSITGRADIDLLAMSLRHKGEPIAEQWGFVHAGRYYAFVATRDFGNSDESPGKLHLGEVIRTIAERGLAGCDLGVPAMPYKLTWATDVATVRDYSLPVTPRGLLMVKVWDVWLRPRLKSLVLKLPAAIRSRAMRAAGHGH